LRFFFSLFFTDERIDESRLLYALAFFYAYVILCAGKRVCKMNLA